MRERMVPEQRWSLELAIVPTKNHSKIDWLVEKCTELGASKITFIKSHRSERPKINLQRLNRIAVSAMKQSGRAYLPSIEDLIGLTFFVRRSDLPQSKFIAHCEPGEKLELSDLKRGEEATILIGPEGDFTSEEVLSAKANGFRELSLGNDRLRTETAGIHVTSVVNFINQ